MLCAIAVDLNSSKNPCVLIVWIVVEKNLCDGTDMPRICNVHITVTLILLHSNFKVNQLAAHCHFLATKNVM